MGAVVPAFAAVRPRVRAGQGEPPRLLEEVVAELAEEHSSGIAWILGKPGAGKSTAVAHLAALFAHEERFILLDASPRMLEPPAERWVIGTSSSVPPGEPRVHLRLAEWDRDDLIEYLLAVHHDACGSVLARLGDAQYGSWSPEIARVVLDRFAADEGLNDPIGAVVHHLKELLGDEGRYAAACEYSLAVQCDVGRAARVYVQLGTAGFPIEGLKLLRHERVQLLLAAEEIFLAISEQGTWHVLQRVLPHSLVETVAKKCRIDTGVIERLQKFLKSRRASAAHAMAASILHAACIGWRPTRRRRGWVLQRGYFGEADWTDVELTRAQLDGADFAGAVLDAALLDEAALNKCTFDGGSLAGASMRYASACGASFRRANLRGAKLPNARLEKADFSDADLRGASLMKAGLKDAILSGANLQAADLTLAYLVSANLEEADLADAVLARADLTQVDLRTARLAGANMEHAWLRGANLEDVEWTNARLQGADLRDAHLTGSRLYAADLQAARLCNAGLGEVDWERADLRDADLTGATFHMGSSRSGLVGSPIACEGSKTGFYTDELEEVYFRPPEEIRKATLRFADLRGAKIDHVDFYLVDLRDAKLDAPQREHVRRCGAILEEPEE